MKRILALLLCLIFILSGCQRPQDEEGNVCFYYLDANPSYDSRSSIFLPQSRQDMANGTMEQILRVYLAGPQDEQFLSPFPAGLQLVSYRLEEKTAYLTFSKDLATLSNLDLTLACGCIAMTVLDLTGSEQVYIDAEGSLLSGQKAIIMDRSNLQLLDNSAQGE